MHHRSTQNWIDPLALLAGMAKEERNWVFLYSGIPQLSGQQRSFLALRSKRIVAGKDFSLLEAVLSQNKECLDNAWFGYLGYELKHALEHFSSEDPSFITLPPLMMVQYRLILIFDHQQKTITLWAQSEEDMKYVPTACAVPTSEVTVQNLSSNMTRTEYLHRVHEIKEAIIRGDLYQANLTRKFYGNFEANIDPVGLFVRLCKASPAPYSALMKMGDAWVVSSSPELFLHIDARGGVTTSPIKGSAPRHADQQKDRQSKEWLRTSIKDRAENLMIVDLMRNDVARSCVPGSVKVEELCALHSYATVHHMHSTIVGQKTPQASALDVVKGCFPPGSMTGAPKIKAIELCRSLEHQARGVYSGALGWFGGDGTVDLSVVIRTLVVDKNRFEFQVGGAIVSDSIPEEEWRETLIKSRGIAEALGLQETSLEQL